MGVSQFGSSRTPCTTTSLERRNDIGSCSYNDRPDMVAFGGEQPSYKRKQQPVAKIKAIREVTWSKFL